MNFHVHRSFVWDVLNTSETGDRFPRTTLVGRPRPGDLGGTRMDSYAWIRVVTDEWEYTERVA